MKNFGTCLKDEGGCFSLLYLASTDCTIQRPPVPRATWACFWLRETCILSRHCTVWDSHWQLEGCDGVFPYWSSNTHSSRNTPSLILFCQVQRTRLMQGKAPLEGLPHVQEPDTGVRPATTVRLVARIHLSSFVPSFVLNQRTNIF